MLIGISGYIGSGKDTVALAIQYLVHKKALGFNDCTDEEGFLIWLDKHYDAFPTQGWTIKKFAGKLKQMVSMMTGIPIQDLELQSVKDSFLGPEWDKQMMPESFRGTSTDFINMMRKDDNLVHDGGSYQVSGLEHVFNYHVKTQRMTVREILQKFGTDAIRNNVHPNAWVNAMFAEYKPDEWNGKPNPLKVMPNWVISDCRFPNEAQAIKDRGGLVIRVERKWTPEPGETIGIKVFSNWTTVTYTHSKDGEHYGVGSEGYKYKSTLIRKHNLHASETSLDNWPFDFVIHNDGTLEELLEVVKEYLTLQKII